MFEIPSVKLSISFRKVLFKICEKNKKQKYFN